MASDRGNLSRKMAAILHADVTGSTALVQLDEALTHERINEAFSRFSQSIQQYGGTVHEIRGDALVGEFHRASDAVCAALAFQESHSQVLDQLDDEIIPKIRIGVSLGEVIFADGQVTGAGVVLAQRVEQLAEPGGLSITGAVHEMLPQHLPIDQDDLGDQEVKGFNEPVRVYTVRLKEGSELPEPVVLSETKRTSAVQWMMVAAVVVLICGGALLAWVQPWQPDFEPASVEKMALPLPDKPSIAVLPFDNYSDEEKLDFFADGMTENITSALSKAPGLFVIARNSAATYKGKAVNVKQVAEELGVQYVLEGSVQKSGDQLRITAQLVDAVNGHHLWTDRFDRRADDVFAVQDEITRHVVTELQVELTMGDHARMAGGGTDNLEAWLLRIEAYAEFIKFSRESQIRARELYQQAHEADPGWSVPVAGIAFTHWYEARLGWSDSRDDSIRLGIDFAERAIELNPEDPLGHMVLGNLMILTGEIDKAIELKHKGIELAPNSFVALAGLAIRLAELEREQEAIELFERAIRVSPKHPWWIDAGYGLALHLAGRKEEAAKVYQQGISAGGANNAPIQARLAAVYVDQGRLEDAKGVINQALRIDPQFTVEKYQKSYAFPSVERNEWYKELLVRSGLPEHPPLELPDKPSIAVLPFTNMSDDPQQEYFVDGMTEDLITDLSKVSALFVVARNSSFTYKGRVVDVKNVARDLGVRYVLEGSVRRAGSQVRINAQLVDATTGGHLWAERYDGTLENVFGLQDQVTQQIVNALAVNLTSTEKVEHSQKETDIPQAYDAFLQGWQHYLRQTPEDFILAIGHFNKAVELDPQYSRAHAALAATYWETSERFWQENVGLARVHDASFLAEQALAKAMENPTPLAHQVSAAMLLHMQQHEEAIAETRRAIALDPNDADSFVALAGALSLAGEPNEALKQVEHAMRLNPHYPPSYLYELGVAQFALGELEKATAAFEKAITLNPFDRWSHRLLIATYGLLDRTEDATRTLDAIDEIDKRGKMNYFDPFTIRTSTYWVPFKDPAVADRLVQGLRSAGVPD